MQWTLPLLKVLNKKCLLWEGDWPYCLWNPLCSNALWIVSWWIACQHCGLHTCDVESAVLSNASSHHWCCCSEFLGPRARHLWFLALFRSLYLFLQNVSLICSFWYFIPWTPLQARLARSHVDGSHWVFELGWTLERSSPACSFYKYREWDTDKLKTSLRSHS